MRTIKNSILHSTFGLFTAIFAIASFGIGCSDYSSGVGSIDPGIKGWSHSWGVTQTHQRDSSNAPFGTKKDTMAATKINELQRMVK